MSMTVVPRLENE